MSDFSFNARGFGFASFAGASAVAGAMGGAGVRGVQQAAADLAYRGSRQRVASRLRSMREEARQHAVDLSLARLESALRLRYIEKNLGAGSQRA